MQCDIERGKRNDAHRGFLVGLFLRDGRHTDRRSRPLTYITKRATRRRNTTSSSPSTQIRRADTYYVLRGRRRTREPSWCFCGAPPWFLFRARVCAGRTVRHGSVNARPVYVCLREAPLRSFRFSFPRSWCLPRSDDDEARETMNFAHPLGARCSCGDQQFPRLPLRRCASVNSSGRTYV